MNQYLIRIVNEQIGELIEEYSDCDNSTNVKRLPELWILDIKEDGI